MNEFYFLAFKFSILHIQMFHLHSIWLEYFLTFYFENFMVKHNIKVIMYVAT